MSVSVFLTLYRFLTPLLLPVAVLHHLYRSRQRGRPASLGERFYRSAVDPPPKGKRVILLHGVSVGETIAARPLIRALRREYPDSFLVMTTGTETGQEIARGIPELDRTLYFPFADFTGAVGRMYDTLAPALVIVMETELWPNLFASARQRSIPLVIANGRISDRSFPRYRRFSFLFRPILSLVDRFLMQTPLDAERIVAIGASPERVESAGNLKYDIPLIMTGEEERQGICRAWHLPGHAPLLLCASTHRGEEEIIAQALTRLDTLDDLRVVVVPRHPERGGEATLPFRNEGFDPVLFSEWGERTEPLRRREILVVDRIGVLMELYRIATIAFVGGSLVPHGGHNLLEPASCGVPIIHGPHLQNFREMAAIFAERQGSVTVTDSPSLAAAVMRLCADAGLRSTLGERGRGVVADNRGALDRHLAVIRGFLGGERCTE